MTDLKAHGSDIFIIGKGKTGYKVHDLYMLNPAPIWCLNNMVPTAISTIEHFHWDIHKPRHHPDAEILQKYLMSYNKHQVGQVKIFTHEMFPWEEILSVFPVKFYFTTIAYMISLAIFLGYKRLRMPGIDYFSGEHDPEMVMACIEFWIGVAKGRGCTVELSNFCKLFQTPTAFKYKNYQLGFRMGRERGWFPTEDYLYDEKYIYL
jgi:hypothetical protein